MSFALKSMLTLAGVLTGLAASTAQAESAAEFYRGRTVHLYVAAGAGGSYGPFAQLVAQHLPKHLAGAPVIAPQFMPGAGGAKGANYVYSAAPRDGSAIGLLLKYIVVDKMVAGEALRYDPAKFNWLASAGPINSVVHIWSQAPATTLEAAKTAALVMGSTGKSSETFITPALMNALLGTKFKIVTGYKGMPDMAVAMERRELDGRASTWDGLKAEKPDWIRDRKIVVIAQSGLEKNADLPDVPRLVDLAKSPDDRRIFEFFGSGSTLGRIFVAPPEVPADRLAALRAAFDAMLADAAFRADAERFRVDVGPKSWREIETLVRATLATPPEIVERAKRVISQ